MTSTDALKQRIHAAFADVSYPGDGCLVRSREGDEPYLLEEAFKGKDDWSKLDAAFLDQAPDGFSTALSFFSDEALRFYLPAFLIADIDERLESADPVFQLCHGFSGKARRQRVNPQRYGDWTWLDEANQRLSGFSPDQCAVIVAYLRHRLEQCVLATERREIEEAIEAFWLDRAGGESMP